MDIEIEGGEKELLRTLKNGISKVLVYKSGLYPTAVSFLLEDGTTISIRVKEEHIADRFEVFPISITKDVPNAAPGQEFDGSEFTPNKGISILTKTEWDRPATANERQAMVGDTAGATVQTEGKLSDIPGNALNRVSLHAGIEIARNNKTPFIIASSMFPYALYVTDCDFSEQINDKFYDRENLY